MKTNPIIKAFWKRTERLDKKRMAAQVAPDFDEAQLDIDYAGDGHAMHTLNVYRPKGADGKLPVIMDVHGGGWYYGDKELNEYYCRSLVRYGFAVVDISYRLAPEADIKAQIGDVFAAMKYVAEHAEQLALDMDNFFIAGDSAGGHIAGLVANIIKSEELQKYYDVTPSVDVKAAGLICPAADPLDMFALPKGLMKLYFNPILGKGYLKGDIREMASFTATLQKDICPCFFISAYADFLRESTKRAYEAVRAQGTKAELFFLDAPYVKEHKLVHVFNVLYWDWEESEAANRAMCDFFKSCM